MKKQFFAVAAAICVGITGVLGGMHISLASQAESTQPIRIMAVGDSITDGYIDGNNGYRKYFCYEMQQKGFTDFDMVGSNNNWSNEAAYDYNGVTITYDPAHSGFSGYSIEAYPGRSGIYETIFNNTYYSGSISGNMLEVYDPDIVMLQIGTNDILDAKLDGSKERLEKLVDAILAEMDGSNDMLFLASIPEIDALERYDWLGAYETVYGVNYYEDAEAFAEKVEECVAAYNQIVQQVVEERQESGERIRFADIHSVVDMETGLYDGVHPNESGYSYMGTYWSDQIYTYLSEIGVAGTNGTTENPVTIPTEQVTVTVVSEDVTTTTEEMMTEVGTTVLETLKTEETTADTTNTSTTTGGTTIVVGDLNQDEQVNIADTVLLCRYLLGKPASNWSVDLRADMNADGRINGMDLSLLRQRIIESEV